MDVSVCELVVVVSFPIGFSTFTVPNVITSPSSMSSWVNCKRSDNVAGDTRAEGVRSTRDSFHNGGRVRHHVPFWLNFTRMFRHLYLIGFDWCLLPDGLRTLDVAHC